MTQNKKRLVNLALIFAVFQTSHLSAQQLVEPSPATEKIIRALSRDSFADYFEVKTRILIEELKRDHSISIGFHPSAIELGLSEDCVVTLETEITNTQDMLLLLAEDYQCTLTIEDDKLLFISKEEAAKGEWLLAWTFKVNPFASTPESQKKLAEVIRVSIDPESWRTKQGSGLIIVGDGTMAIEQTLLNMRKVRNLLATLSDLSQRRDHR